MRSIIVAGALAFGVLGISGKADAQFGYGYNPYPVTYVNPYTGMVVNSGNLYAPNVYRNVTNYYSPYTGLSRQQVYTADIFGNRVVQSYGYNPFFGRAYNRGVYVNPYTGAHYRYGYRW